MTEKKPFDKNRLFELLSALQKSIRRGLEYEALHFAACLEKEYTPSHAWNKLKVIASEDIGCANSNMPILIETLEKQYKEANVEEKPLFLSNAVITLCKSPKSRIADDLLNVIYGEIQHENKKLPVPDYALDKHTLKGRKMGRGWEHFF